MTPTTPDDKKLELAMFAALAIGALCLGLINFVFAPALLAKPAPARVKSPAAIVEVAAPNASVISRSAAADAGVVSAAPLDSRAAETQPTIEATPTPRVAQPPLPATINFRKRAGVWLNPAARRLLDKLAEKMNVQTDLRVQLRGHSGDRFGKLRCQAIVYYLRRMSISPKRVVVQLDSSVQPGRVELSWVR